MKIYKKNIEKIILFAGNHINKTFIGLTVCCAMFIAGWYSGQSGHELQVIDAAEAAGGQELRS